MQFTRTTSPLTPLLLHFRTDKTQSHHVIRLYHLIEYSKRKIGKYKTCKLYTKEKVKHREKPYVNSTMIRFKKKLRGHPGLNRGPLDLQSNALPLSYTPNDSLLLI